MKLQNIFVCTILIIVISGFSFTQTSATPAQTMADSLGDWTCWDDGTIDPCHNSLNSIYLDTVTNGWSVGENGTIMHWDGYQWSKTTSPTNSTLNDVQQINDYSIFNLHR
jgi:hypothetical protein